MFEARELHVCPLQQRFDPLEVHHACGMYLGFEYQTLRVYACVSTSKCRFLPFIFLPPSYARGSSPTPVLFTDWLSTMPALG
jgi:hypothetical protein